MSNWLDLSNVSNRLNSTYVKTFLDISGNLVVRSGVLFSYVDISNNGRLFVGNDISANGKMYLAQDLSANRNANIGGNLLVKTGNVYLSDTSASLTVYTGNLLIQSKSGIQLRTNNHATTSAVIVDGNSVAVGTTSYISPDNHFVACYGNLYTNEQTISNKNATYTNSAGINFVNTTLNTQLNRNRYDVGAVTSKIYDASHMNLWSDSSICLMVGGTAPANVVSAPTPAKQYIFDVSGIWLPTTTAIASGSAIIATDTPIWLSNNQIFLRSSGTTPDKNHSIGYVQNGSDGITVDGPGIFGYGGGVLGTTGIGNIKENVLRWDANKNCYFYGNISFNAGFNMILNGSKLWTNAVANTTHYIQRTSDGLHSSDSIALYADINGTTISAYDLNGMNINGYGLYLKKNASTNYIRYVSDSSGIGVFSNIGGVLGTCSNGGTYCGNPTTYGNSVSSETIALSWNNLNHCAFYGNISFSGALTNRAITNTNGNITVRSNDTIYIECGATQSWFNSLGFNVRGSLVMLSNTVWTRSYGESNNYISSNNINGLSISDTTGIYLKYTGVNKITIQDSVTVNGNLNVYNHMYLPFTGDKYIQSNNAGNLIVNNSSGTNKIIFAISNSEICSVSSAGLELVSGKKLIVNDISVNNAVSTNALILNSGRIHTKTTADTNCYVVRASDRLAISDNNAITIYVNGNNMCTYYGSNTTFQVGGIDIVDINANGVDLKTNKSLIMNSGIIYTKTIADTNCYVVRASDRLAISDNNAITIYVNGNNMCTYYGLNTTFQVGGIDIVDINANGVDLKTNKSLIMNSGIIYTKTIADTNCYVDRTPDRLAISDSNTITIYVNGNNMCTYYGLNTTFQVGGIDIVDINANGVDLKTNKSLIMNSGIIYTKTIADTNCYVDRTPDRLAISDSNTITIYVNGSDIVDINANGVNLKNNKSLFMNSGKIYTKTPTDANCYMDYENGLVLSDENKIVLQIGVYDLCTFTNTGGTGAYEVNVKGDIQAYTYNAVSDQRLKTNILPLESQWENIKRVLPSSYTWKSNQKSDTGFIAQQLHSVYPHMRKRVSDSMDSASSLDEPTDLSGNPLYYTVDYGKMTPYLWKGMQEIIEVVETQQTKIETQEREIQFLKSQLSRVCQSLGLSFP